MFLFLTVIGIIASIISGLLWLSAISGSSNIIESTFFFASCIINTIVWGKLYNMQKTIEYQQERIADFAKIIDTKKDTNNKEDEE